MRWVDQGEFIVDKVYTLKRKLPVDLDLRIKNTTGNPISYSLETEFSAQNNERRRRMFMPPVYLFNSICQHGDDFERLPAEDIIENIEDEESHENTFEDGVAWVGSIIAIS